MKPSKEGLRVYFGGDEWTWLELSDLISTLRKEGITRGNFRERLPELFGSDRTLRRHVEELRKVGERRA